MQDTSTVEHVETVVIGGEVDHLPCMVWVHFVTDALPGEETAHRQGCFDGVGVTYCFYSVFTPDSRITLAQRTASDF